MVKLTRRIPGTATLLACVFLQTSGGNEPSASRNGSGHLWIGHAGVSRHYTLPGWPDITDGPNIAIPTH